MEWYNKYDPKDARSHPWLHFHRTGSAGLVDIRWIKDGVWESHGIFKAGVYLVINQRRRLTGALQIRERGGTFVPATLGPNFQLRLHPPADLLLGPPGGSLSDEDLILSVASDGTVSFDIMLPEQIASRVKWTSQGMAHAFDVSLYDAAAGNQRLKNYFSVRAMWLEPALASRAEEVTGQEAGDLLRSVPNAAPESRVFRLHWPARTSHPFYVLIEVADTGPEGQWLPVCAVNGDGERPQSTLVSIPYAGSVPVPASPVFRVSPVHFAPP